MERKVFSHKDFEKNNFNYKTKHVKIIFFEDSQLNIFIHFFKILIIASTTIH